MKTSFDSDSIWVPPRLPDTYSSGLSEEDTWTPEQLSQLQTLMSIRGFEAAYLVNCTHASHSTIVGNRSLVTKQQLAMVHESLQIGAFDQLALTLTDLYVLVRRTEQLDCQACVLLIERERGNPTLAMKALKEVCATLA